MAIAYNTNIVRSGLVLHLDAANVKSYPGSGTVWTDLSGLGNNGTLVNGVGFSADNKGSMVFDGGDDYGSLNLATLAAQASVTTEAIIKFTSLSSRHAIISHGRSGGSFNYGMVIFNNTLHFRNTSGDYALSSPTTLVTNQWYHLVLSSTSTETTGFCNAISQGTTSFRVTTNAFSDLAIGRRALNSSSEYTGGNIAMIKVYHNKALTLQEVQINFNALRGRYGI